MERIALVDFCETIVSFQTYDSFLKFVLINELPRHFKIIGNKKFIKMYEILEKISRKTGINWFSYKQLLTYQTKGMEYSLLERYGKDFYDKKLKSNFIIPTIELIKDLQKENYRIILVSGGSDLYIKQFADEFGIKDILTSQIEFKNGISTGRLISDCMGWNKVELVKEYVKHRKIQGIFETGISDSKSDLPVLNLCKRKIVISRNSHQYWVENEMEEIVWK
ncbi:MAG: HAD-IB family phosphatase [Lachnospiraceae bacterium]|jgi:HAD superfamily hydrolase (TIGR01490 family)|nr:HAD-IB family phosphatase [Lachnospiraceae bacterium]